MHRERTIGGPVKSAWIYWILADVVLTASRF